MSFIAEFNDLMTRGGPIMWVIFVTAWIAFIMLCERALQVQVWIKRAVRDQATLQKDTSLELDQISARRASPASILLRRLDWAEIHNKEDLSKQINIHFTELMPRLEGMLPTIAVLGTLLPMLGLLGTVVGMIDVFEVIALHGTGNPQQMAHGISQALLTTASGLIIAIPVIFFHHLLVRRLQYLLALTEQSLLLVYNHGINGNTPSSANDNTVLSQ
ncbi:MAG: MotA/TolQ/ExbB proton channel family protein [Gammaproteobacteria bacterium]|jgi:biopolymer transport protein ExbB